MLRTTAILLPIAFLIELQWSVLAQACGDRGEPARAAVGTGPAPLPASLLVAAAQLDGWDVPAPVDTIINTPGEECAPAIAWSGDRLYFERDVGGQKDIFFSRHLPSGWTAPLPIQGLVNTPLYSETKPAVSAGGDTLFFCRQGDILWSVWAGTGWGAPQPFTVMNSTSDESSPYISADGREFYFTSDRPGGYGWMDIYVSTWNGSIWSTPANAGPNVNTSDNEWYCCPSPDGLTLYFVTSRPGGWGNIDLWQSRRAQGEWSLPASLGGIANSTGPSCRPSISRDGRVLYFGGARPREGEGVLDIWYTTWNGPGEP